MRPGRALHSKRKWELLIIAIEKKEDMKLMIGDCFILKGQVCSLTPVLSLLSMQHKQIIQYLNVPDYSCNYW